MIYDYMLAQLLIILEWKDPRLQWRNETGIGNWTFPSSVYYPIKDMLVPSFRLSDCQSEKCIVKPQESQFLLLHNDGRVVYESELTWRSKCYPDLKCK